MILSPLSSKTKIAAMCTIMVVFFLLTEHENVSADAAPQPGAIASNLSSNLNQTKVRMEAETVVIAIPEQSDYFSGHANVTATFYMRNMGDETEVMNARFPMNMSEYNMGYEIINGIEYCSYISDFPSIDNLSVFIDGKQVNISTTENDIDLHKSLGAPEGTIRHIKCWAHFDVTFPPEQQVIIQIQYKVAGYQSDPRQISYKYIMQTGQGWYGTIGSADIVVKLPFEVNNTNLLDCSPDDCQIVGNLITWNLKDFEPEENIEVDIIDPSIWGQVVRETKNVEKKPEDGEAWGRLGMAYKQTITDRHGFILSNESPNSYRLSEQAYLNALELIPNDIDWHYGYAELICKNTLFIQSSFSQKDNKERENCSDQLKYILDRNPNHENTLIFLEWMRSMTKSYPDLEIPEYLILTTLPSRTRSSTPTVQFSSTQSVIQTKKASSTPSAIDTGSVYTNTPIPAINETQLTKERNRVLFAIGINLLFVVMFFLVIRSDQPKQ